MAATLKRHVALHTAKNIVGRGDVNFQDVPNARKAGRGSASVMGEEDAANLKDVRKELEINSSVLLTEVENAVM